MTRLDHHCIGIRNNSQETLIVESKPNGVVCCGTYQVFQPDDVLPCSPLGQTSMMSRLSEATELSVCPRSLPQESSSLTMGIIEGLLGLPPNHQFSNFPIGVSTTSHYHPFLLTIILGNPCLRTSYKTSSFFAGDLRLATGATQGL